MTLVSHAVLRRWTPPTPDQSTHTYKPSKLNRTTALPSLYITSMFNFKFTVRVSLNITHDFISLCCFACLQQAGKQLEIVKW